MKTRSAVHPLRMRRFEGSVRDPYAARGKLKSPTVCPACKAVFEKGRWHWRESPPADAHRATCPACQRIRDRYPAGMVALKGAFSAAMRRELIAAARNEETKEMTEHPLNRIMSVSSGRGGIAITTTDIHLPRLIGEAVRRSHGGTLRLRYDVDGCEVQVDWTRKA